VRIIGGCCGCAGIVVDLTIRASLSAVAEAVVIVDSVIA
jgi:hypothetical protein